MRLILKVQHSLDRNPYSQKVFLPTHLRTGGTTIFFFYNNSSCRYYLEAQDYTPTEMDYREWLEGLPAAMREDMKRKGFEGCRTVLSFTRYVMEKNDVGMEAYVREKMGEEYAAYQALVNPPTK